MRPREAVALCAAGYSGEVSVNRGTDNTPVVSAWQRRRLLASAAVCVLIVVALAVLVHAGSAPLSDVDRDFGTPAEAWSLRHHAAVTVLLSIEVLFGTLGTTVYVVALVSVLWLRRRRRAVVWTVVVMVGTAVTTTVLKLLLRRQRPRWDVSVHTLTSYSFPSGHASGIAYCRFCLVT